ncbi:hypothetical protein JOC93_001068 [Priestia taiwanensis]|nr:hypothetical protein [Priestia taiwanensis]
MSIRRQIEMLYQDYLIHDIEGIKILNKVIEDEGDLEIKNI